MRPCRQSCQRVFLVFVLTICAAIPSLAAPITVTSLADDGSPGTLRGAIAAANPGDTINFSITARLR